jgi:hypothetical protein
MPFFLAPHRWKKLLALLPRRERRTVERFNLSHKEKQGWWLETGQEPVWHGYYRSRYGPSYKGRVEHLADPKFYIQIAKPPQQLREHTHWICFREQRTKGWYWVHLSPVPQDIDSGIFAIERVLNDALTPLKKSA